MLLAPRRIIGLKPITPVPGATPPAAAVPVSPSGGTGPVQIQSLSEIDPDSVGVIDDSTGGLGANMWDGLDRATVTRVVGLLPQRIQSPAQRDLLRRLLLTHARAPARSENAPSLFPLRVAALFAAGDLDSTMALIASAPPGNSEEFLVRTQVESRLFANDTAGACTQVQGPGQAYKDIYWQQATAFCLALADKRGEASLMAEVLEERSSAINPAFFAAMEQLSGATPPPVESLKAPLALYLSMMRVASLSLPGDVTENASPAALKGVALSPNATLELRLIAAEDAATLGVLSGKTLTDIYSAVRFEPAILANARNEAAGIWGAPGRALLMRVAAFSQSAEDRAAALQQAIRIAREKGGMRITALATRPFIDVLQTDAGMEKFAPDLARAQILAGNLASARIWLDFAWATAGDSAARAGLWPLASLMLPAEQQVITPEQMQGWWQSQPRGAAEAVTRAGILFSLLEAFGVEVPATLWGGLIGNGAPSQSLAPPPAILKALARTAANGQKGGVVALALIALGEAGPVPENLVAVEAAIRALRAVGLVEEARQIALETAVTAGL